MKTQRIIIIPACCRLLKLCVDRNVGCIHGQRSNCTIRFYTLRAILALRGIAIFYLGSTPWWVRAAQGDTARHTKGNTHSVVLQSFEELFPTHLLTQNIGADNASAWLIDRREDANYKLGRFLEPAVPPHFEFVVNTGIRKALQMYLHRDNELLAFDPNTR